MTVYNHFDDLYLNLIQQVMNYGKDQVNQRTGSTVRAMHGLAAKWDMNFYPLPVPAKLPQHNVRPMTYR